MPVPDLCFSIGRFDLLNVHATSGYQNNASTDYKDCTDDVEDCGTDATGGRKFRTRLVKNICYSVVCRVNLNLLLVCKKIVSFRSHSLFKIICIGINTPNNDIARRYCNNFNTSFICCCYTIIIIINLNNLDFFVCSSWCLNIFCFICLNGISCLNIKFEMCTSKNGIRGIVLFNLKLMSSRCGFTIYRLLVTVSNCCLVLLINNSGSVANY